MPLGQESPTYGTRAGSGSLSFSNQPVKFTDVLAIFCHIITSLPLFSSNIFWFLMSKRISDLAHRKKGWRPLF